MLNPRLIDLAAWIVALAAILFPRTVDRWTKTLNSVKKLELAYTAVIGVEVGFILDIITKQLRW